MIPENEILKELHELRSPLADFPRELPFRAPEGYFSGLAEELSSKATAEEVRPVKANPFQLPGGYLDQLPHTLLQTALAHESAAQQPKTISLATLWKQHLGRIAVAAMLVMGISIGAYTYLKPVPAEDRLSRQLQGIDAASIDDYLDQHLDEFDPEALEASLLATNTNPGSELSELGAAEIGSYLEEEAIPGDSGNTNESSN